MFFSKLDFVTNNALAIFTIFLCFGCSLISFAYLNSFLFQKSSTAFKAFPILNLFVWWNIPLILCNLIKVEILVNIFQVLSFFCSPFLSLSLSFAYVIKSNGKLYPWALVSNSYYYCLIMIGQTILYLCIVLFIENRKNQLKELKPADQEKIEKHRRKSSGLPTDITNEANLVANDEENKYKIKSIGVNKIYDNGFQALKNVSLGVESNQIFGLLGPNGAGKSTIFNCMTSLIPKTTGSIQLKGQEINSTKLEIFKDVAICPQFDCLWDNLTPIEHLYLFGRMKGLSGKELKESVEYFMSTMQLNFFKNTRAKRLSGGNKRKLCVANALIGGPDLQFFDEPSSGIDPIAKRFLWNTLSQSLDRRNSSIILTTHTMAEAESLCHKIGILINGKFKCIGSNQQLKSKYGSGYTLLVRSKKSDIIQIIQDFFVGCEVRERGEYEYKFKIPKENFSFFNSFKFLYGDLQTNKIIDDFSLTQCSLEEIFIHFSKFQIKNKED